MDNRDFTRRCSCFLTTEHDCLINVARIGFVIKNDIHVEALSKK